MIPICAIRAGSTVYVPGPKFPHSSDLHAWTMAAIVRTIPRIKENLMSVSMIILFLFFSLSFFSSLLLTDVTFI